MLLLIGQRGATQVHRVRLHNTDAPPRRPDHTEPVDVFFPILGDPDHMVHKTGELRYWVVGLDGAVTLDPDVQDLPGVQWLVMQEACTVCRVSRQSPEYQRALTETFDGLNEPVECRNGHPMVTSATTPGRCPVCGEPRQLTVV